MNSLVSIIVPVYNAQDYVGKCIASILAQSYTNIELILVNDGSTDKSEDVCRKYARLDERIKIFSQSNGGVSNARNKGLDKASGEYIMFVDADDYIESNMVEVMYKAIKEENVSMSIAGMKVVRKSEKNGEDIREDLPQNYESKDLYVYKGYRKVITSREEYLSA